MGDSHVEIVLVEQVCLLITTSYSHSQSHVTAILVSVLPRVSTANTIIITYERVHI